MQIHLTLHDATITTSGKASGALPFGVIPRSVDSAQSLLFHRTWQAPFSSPIRSRGLDARLFKRDVIEVEGQRRTGSFDDPGEAGADAGQVLAAQVELILAPVGA